MEGVAVTGSTVRRRDEGNTLVLLDGAVSRRIRTEWLRLTRGELIRNRSFLRRRRVFGRNCP